MMDAKIREILKKAGIDDTKTERDILTLLVLGNSDFFSSFSENLKNILSGEEYEKVMTFFNFQRERFASSQEEYERTMKEIYKNAEVEYFSHHKPNVEDIDVLRQGCPFLFQSK